MADAEIKFDHGQFSGYINNTGGSIEDLGTLVKRLVKAAEPLEGKFKGDGRAVFRELHRQADEVSMLVQKGMVSLNEGQSGMSDAVVQGDQAMADAANAQMSAANFDGAKFRA